MKKSPKISVVIPAFNKVKFVAQTLESIFSQNYDNFEVIVQDGASTDGTVDFFREYAKRYPGKIKLETKKDAGQLDAIIRGLKKANGDLITFINADDCYLPGAFEVVAASYRKNPESDWFTGRGIVVDEKNREIAKPVSTYKNFLLTINHYSLLLVVNYIFQPSVFLTAKTYKENGPFTGTKSFVMEYEMWLKLGKKEMPVVINKDLTRFRIEATTKTKTMFDKLLAEDEKILHKYTKNPFIIFLHELHNLARKVVGRFV